MAFIEPEPAEVAPPDTSVARLGQPITITQSKVLVVEGRDAFEFFKAMLRHLELLVQVVILNAGGVGEWPRYFRNLRRIPGFDTVPVASLGVVRDADQDATRAFESVCGILSNANFSVPGRPIGIAPGSPTVSVFILPDCAEPGMLETLCLRAVHGDRAMTCVEQYFNCLDTHMGSDRENVEKARLQAFLASRRRHCPLLGNAAHAGHLNWVSPVYGPIKDFLKAL